MIFPATETPRLHLDAITDNDRQSIFDIFSNTELVKYYDLEAFHNISQAENFIQLVNHRFINSLGIRWAIRLQGDDKCIGSCGFNTWNDVSHSATIGYELNQAYWGNGYMSEALFKIIAHAFNGDLACKNINRIQADTVPGNIASERVLQKLGFIEEGIRRESGYWNNAYHDLKCFGLLKKDFR